MDFQNTYHTYCGKVILLRRVTGALYNSRKDQITSTTSVYVAQIWESNYSGQNHTVTTND